MRPRLICLRRWPGTRVTLAALLVTALFQPGAVAQAQPAATAVTVLGVGDIMLVQGMAELVRAHGPAYPFEKVRPLFASADLVIGNLEAPFTESPQATRYKNPASVRAGRDFILKADPRAAPGLAYAGFHAVSLANNHMMDYNVEGLRETLAILDRLGIRYAGAGMTLEAARRPAVLQRKGLRVALLSYSNILPLNWRATPNRPGVAPARGPGVHEWMQRDIAAARRMNDLVIVAVHWGEHLAANTEPDQVALGRLLLQWGADAVFGHHTHVLQGLEVRGGKIIAYGLGNFVSLARLPAARETIILQLNVDRPHDIGAARAIPVEIRTGQPVPLDPTEGEWILSRLRTLSAPWGTMIEGDGRIRLR